MKKKESLFRIPTTRLLSDGDVAPEVLRVHTIADTLRTLHQAGAIELLRGEQRTEVAEALGVPELWLEAAMGEGMSPPTVSMDLLVDYEAWRTRVFDRKAVA